jgi:hypothetical protein
MFPDRASSLGWSDVTAGFGLAALVALAAFVRLEGVVA